MRRITILIVALFIASACEKGPTPYQPAQPPPAGPTDQERITALLPQHAAVLQDSTFEDPSPTVLTTSPSGLEPTAFARTITSASRSTEFEFSEVDSVLEIPMAARVTLRKNLEGTFDIFNDAARAAGVTHKPLADGWSRFAYFRRVFADPPEDFSWRLEAVAPVRIRYVDLAGDPDQPPRLSSLRIQAAAVDDTVFPGDRFSIGSLLRLSPGEPVTLTTFTTATDDVVGLFQGTERMLFTANGDGSYSLSWRAPDSPGIVHLMVNAILRGSIYSGAVPYQSDAIIVPIDVR